MSIARAMKSSTHADTEINKTCVERGDIEPSILCIAVQ